MNFSHKLLIILSALFFTLNPTVNTLAADYNGHLDGVNENTISGWAWDSTDPESSAVVRVVVRNQNRSIVGDFTAIAKDSRTDLANQFNNKGNYGFVVGMDWSGNEDGCYTIEAYIGDQKFPNSLQYQKGETASGLKSLGTFRTTGYCPCYSCSKGWGRSTATGIQATPNHTIAVDPRVIPYGSKVMINGIIYTAEDKGSGVKGKHIDIYYNTHAETRQHGSRSAEVFLLQ